MKKILQIFTIAIALGAPLAINSAAQNQRIAQMSRTEYQQLLKNKLNELSREFNATSNQLDRKSIAADINNIKAELAFYDMPKRAIR